MNTKLYLLFNLSSERFAVNTANVTEIVPLLDLVKVPKTVPYVRGLINYRGSMITVIDTTQLLYDEPCRKRSCCRIIVVDMADDGQQKQFGLLAEKVNRTCRLKTQELIEHELTQQQTPYLGKLVSQHSGNIQIIDLKQLARHHSSQLKNTIPDTDYTDNKASS